MYLGEEKQKVEHYRPSKLGAVHSYIRIRTWLSFRCDNCGEIFTRLKGKIDPKRTSNNYFHCCFNCDSKRFAQRKGIERRKIWDMPVSSGLNISRL